MRVFNEQELIRRQKAEELKELGIEPFGETISATTNSKLLNDKYGTYSKEELHEMSDLKEEVLTGRIMTKRSKGKVGFMHIQDKYGQIQIYVRKDMIPELEFSLFDKADLGDIVAVHGTVMRTDMGELSIKASRFIHVVKALKPLPEKFHGLSDTEERYRRRYVDLIMNEEARSTAYKRATMMRTIRNYLDNLGYIEVETPILSTILGGASARPFITHHNTLDISMYLRIAPELALKRLIVGGMDAVYEIGRLFRNEGMDKTHNPEFTTIEIYKAYSNLEGMMELTENLVRECAYKINNNYIVEFKGHTLDLEKPFRRSHMVDMIKEVTGINFFDDMSLEDAIKLAKQHEIVLEKHFTYGHVVNAFFEKYVEETIIEPTFVYGHPIEITPLAKMSKDKRFTERFELFIIGNEYGNAYTELNDPIDQYERFLNQVKEKELGNDEANDMDIDFVEALEYAMPPTGGVGIGLDRLIMLLTNNESIREVILFPTMKKRD